MSFIILEETEDYRYLASLYTDAEGKHWIRFTEEEAAVIGDWYQASQFSVSAEALMKAIELLKPLEQEV